jgi:hypothetical protein
MRFSDCPLHRFELRYKALIFFLDLLYEELLINRAQVVKRLETCLSPSSAFNLSLSFNHKKLKIIEKCSPGRNKKREQSSSLI